MAQLIKILGMRKKGNPVILGEAGVGKTFLMRVEIYLKSYYLSN